MQFPVLQTRKTVIFVIFPKSIPSGFVKIHKKRSESPGETANFRRNCAAGGGYRPPPRAPGEGTRRGNGRRPVVESAGLSANSRPDVRDGRTDCRKIRLCESMRKNNSVMNK